MTDLADCIALEKVRSVHKQRVANAPPTMESCTFWAALGGAIASAETV